MNKINKLLIVDTETTGTDFNFDKIIEFAGIVYSVEFRTVITQLSFLMPCQENKAESINKINAKASLLQDITPISYVEELFNSVDAIVAHNSEFDKEWVKKLINLHTCSSKPWICSLRDIEWTDNNGSLKLTELALSRGIPVLSAHRALTDCQLLAEIFTREPNLESILISALQPKKLYRALVSYGNNFLAKQEGFCWNPISKKWLKSMTEEKACETIERNQNLFKIVEEKLS